ncbi:hypothetical protein [Microseira wollei]|uniref:SCP2 domain-containing protein n=1 Tax=Microseira wollei NIES-4236 TaxID=2530354 RepID=A0AAV3X5C0_9CYAN|nr:hypothetical protein [Microseira wollei]GET35790.1 hypothetical protein MiSe_05360 [Microseira wollei NIES-4236]
MYKVMDRKEIAALGASLRPIDQNLLKKDANIERLWYQGEESYFDIILKIQNHEIIWFEFTLRGQVLVWDKQNPVMQTGTTNELGTGDLGYYAASKLIKLDRKNDQGFIKLAHSILQTRSGEDIFARVLTLFKD